MLKVLGIKVMFEIYSNVYSFSASYPLTTTTIDASLDILVLEIAEINYFDL